MATALLKTCSVCSTQFMIKSRWQIAQRDGQTVYYCSQGCRNEASAQEGQTQCSTCGTMFVPKYAYQQGVVNGQTLHFCSMECRNPVVTEIRRRVVQDNYGPMRVAVLNQKGGTGKTTTTVALAAGLAQAGYKVLVLDIDAQGHVAISLGVRGERTLYHILVERRPLAQCVTEARPNIDVVVGNDTLASAEIYLARMNEGRDRLLRDRLSDQLDSYDYVLLDCGPSLSLMNLNALTFAEHLIVPVSCDYLSLVGVKQVMKTLRNVNQVLMHPISILGILPTFYDMRNNISDESVKTLKGYFHDKVMPPIRVNTRLKEAPQHHQSIFEYAPESRGARDYQKVVDWIVRRRQQRLQPTGT